MATFVRSFVSSPKRRPPRRFAARTATSVEYNQLELASFADTYVRDNRHDLASVVFIHDDGSRTEFHRAQ